MEINRLNVDYVKVNDVLESAIKSFYQCIFYVAIVSFTTGGYEKKQKCIQINFQ